MSSMSKFLMPPLCAVMLIGSASAEAVRFGGRDIGTKDGGTSVGATVKLKGVNPQFEGAYCVTAATHLYDQRTGYITEFAAESAFFGGGG